MDFTQRFTEVLEVAGVIDPDAYAAAAYNTAWMSMSNHQRAAFIVMVGTMASGATADFLLQQAQDGAGTGAKAITGKAITQLTQAGGDGDDVCVVELRTEELDVDNGFEYVRGVLTIGTDAVDAAVLPLRFVAAYPPVPTTNITEVVD